MENAKLSFLHVCDFVSFSNGKLNVLGIFKQINVASLPVEHPQMFIVSNIKIFKSGKYKQTLKLINDAKKTVIFVQDLDVNIQISKEKKMSEVGSVAQLNNIKFENYGKYKVQIFLNENLVDESIIEVKK